MVSKKLVRLNKEKTWLKREKYGGKTCEVAFSSTKNDFSPFARDLARLEQGEPLDYIIGWREFLGCKIDLSAKPLIPREETEFWVGETIKELNLEAKPPSGRKPQLGGLASKPLNVLDLFAGSGCIGLAVLKHIPNAKVTFGDLYPINKRTIKTDIFSNIKGKFDIIFANPPYIPTKKSGSTSLDEARDKLLTASHVQKSVKDWEPKEALYAGSDGLAIIKKFLKQAKDHLNVGGLIYLEFGYGQKLAITKLLKQSGYTHYQFNKDQFGKWRWVVIVGQIVRK